jgi:AhpD family alkylhydroperoxidase
MARLPYANVEDPCVAPLAMRIAAERGSVLHLYQMLLHSPPVAEGWLTYLTAIRQKCVLSPLLRELVIMRVASVNRAPYEAEQHAPIALREGVTQAQLDKLAHWEASGLFTPEQRSVLALCDAMTTRVQVPARLISELRAFLGERELVELVATVAAYNMVSRFLEALQIHSDEATPHLA